MSERLPAWSIALVSGAALANEVLLTRYFAVVHWHHFATMMISLALLGFGASGTFVTLARRWLLARFVPAYVANLLAFGVLAIAAPVAASALPFQAEQLLWDPWQPAVARDDVSRRSPCPSSARATPSRSHCSQWRTRAGRVYAADLVGAGIGSLLDPRPAVPSCLPSSRSSCSPARVRSAAIVALVELRSRWRAAYADRCRRPGRCLPRCPAEWLRAEPGEYKALSQALRVPAYTHRRDALEPARPRRRDRERARAAATCAGLESDGLERTAAATGPLHRRRRHGRDHVGDRPIRRASSSCATAPARFPTRLPRLDPCSWWARAVASKSSVRDEHGADSIDGRRAQSPGRGTAAPHLRGLHRRPASTSPGSSSSSARCAGCWPRTSGATT